MHLDRASLAASPFPATKSHWAAVLDRVGDQAYGLSAAVHCWQTYTAKAAVRLQPQGEEQDRGRPGCAPLSRFVSRQKLRFYPAFKATAFHLEPLPLAIGDLEARPFGSSAKKT